MYGMKKIESKMDVCGFGEQEAGDMVSFMYLPQTLNTDISNCVSTSDIIQPSGDNYLPQAYDPVAATDILTAAVQEIQKTAEKSVELNSTEINSHTHTLEQKQKLEQTIGVEEENQHPIDIQKCQAWKMMSAQYSTDQETPQEEES